VDGNDVHRPLQAGGQLADCPPAWRRTSRRRDCSAV